MAMNGINMPLAVIGSEAVLFETLLDFGFRKEKRLIPFPVLPFWAWQLMTNITGYLPPVSKDYVYERLTLGKRFLKGMLNSECILFSRDFPGMCLP